MKVLKAYINEARNRGPQVDADEINKISEEIISDLQKCKKLDKAVDKLNDILKGSGDNAPIYMRALSDLFSGEEKTGVKHDKFKCAGLADIPVSELYPTQSEIDIVNSAKWATKDWGAACIPSMFDGSGFGASFAVPVLVYDDGKKNWIIDGHHRWSQVGLINYHAKLHCMVIKGSDKVQDFLKLVQGVIAGVAAERPGNDTLPVGNAYPENNIFGSALKGDKLKKRIIDMLEDNPNVASILTSKLASYKEVFAENDIDIEDTPTNEDVARLVCANRDTMMKNGQKPESWAAPRPVMPQSDKAGRNGAVDAGLDHEGSALNKLRNVKKLPKL